MVVYSYIPCIHVVEAGISGQHELQCEDPILRKYGLPFYLFWIALN